MSDGNGSNVSNGGGSGGRRMSRRRRNHSSADMKGPSHKIPDHPLIVAEDPQMIEDQAGLDEFIAHVTEVGCVAYDTEFIGELSYYPELCVVQLATRERLAIVDALADVDLTPLWKMLADASVRKFVHAGSQDLEPVVRHLGVPAANVWDTQIAAGFAGLPYPLSLSKLIHELIGLKLGKGLTFTSWDERPLSKAHQRYAADDVRYLLAATEGLEARLAETGHTEWAIQECAAACDAEQFGFKPLAAAQRMRGAKGLAPKQLAILCELAKMRDSGARERDLPPRSFMKDEVLVDLCRNPVKHPDKLANVRNLPRPVIENYGQHLIDAIAVGLAIPKEDRPRVDKPVEESPQDRLRNEAIWAVVQTWCFSHHIDPALLANRHQVALLLRSERNGTPTPSRLASGWRRELLGDFFGAFVSGDREMTLGWSGEGLGMLNPDTARQGS